MSTRTRRVVVVACALAMILSGCGSQDGGAAGPGGDPQVAYSVAPPKAPSAALPAEPTYGPLVRSQPYPGNVGLTCRPHRSSEDPSSASVMAALVFDSGTNPRSPCQVGVPGTYLSLALAWTGHGGTAAELKAYVLRRETRLRRGAGGRS